MGKRELNPADAYRKEQKKKEIKRSKQTQEKVKEVQVLLNNPEKIADEIKKVQKASDENKLDKSLKDKLKELYVMKDIADKKAQRHMGRKGHPSDAKEEMTSSSNSGIYGPSSSSHSMSGYHSSNAMHQSVPPPPPPINRPRLPQESVYYHPVYNPTGMPPPGQPAIYRQMPGMPIGLQPGIPPPPLAHHPMAYMQSSQSAGYPMYGSNSAIALGGTNGVPLPPPRMAAHDMSQGYMSAAQSKQPMRQMPNNRTADRRVATVDPLDPGAAGYTERFGVKPTKKAQEELQSDDDDDDDGDESIKSEEKEVIVEGPPPGIVIRGNSETVDSVTNNSNDSKIEISVAPPIEPSKVSSVPVLSQPLKINIEEIMRRRNMIQSDSEAVVSFGPSANPGSGENNDDTDQSPAGPSVGPQGPPSLLHVGVSSMASQNIQPPVNGPSSTMPSNLTLTSINAQQSVPSATNQKSRLQVTKTDSELTAFVPSSIRTKRQNQPSEGPSSKALKGPTSSSAAQSTVAHVGPIATSIATSQSENSNTVFNSSGGNAIDDAYESFMSEIRELSGDI